MGPRISSRPAMLMAVAYCLAGVGFCADVPRGYLAVVGPTPLIFQPRPLSPQVRPALPPPHPEPSRPEQAVPADESSAQAQPPEWSMAEPNPSPTRPTAGPEPIQPAAAPELGTFPGPDATPGLLDLAQLAREVLEYLAPGRAGATTNRLAGPIFFVPPLPPPLPTSHATYESR